MLKKRIIAKLEIKGPNLVKGVNLKGLEYLVNQNFFQKIITIMELMSYLSRCSSIFIRKKYAI